MRYQIEEVEGGTLFRPLEERLNATHTPALKAEFAVLAHSRTGGVIIDLSSVQSLDSSVLSALLLLRRMLGERPLAVVAPHPPLRSVFSLSKLDEIFTLMPTIDEALLYLQNQSALVAKKAEEEWEDEEEEWEEEDEEEWEDEDWDEEEWDEEEWDEEEWDEDDWEEEELEEDWEEEEEEEED
ncbi:MAG: STAS domain-containing protein [Bacteroidia bacterium]|jgi:anti-anti-sigma factor|nr:STAS domain-containing protein [Bacteroidia bacterium]GIV23818.1 MAG: hypothetical protein KatS3mg025_1477 [Bacteroidia bacterium]